MSSSRLARPFPGRPLVPPCVLALCAPALAAQAIRLSGPMAAGPGQAGDVQAFAVSPDGTRVVYAADQETAGVVELFSVPVDGSGSPAGISGVLVAGGDCLNDGSPDFAVAPGSQHVVYVADAEADEVFELFRAPLDGSAGPTKLDAGLVDGGDVRSFRIRPDGAQVVFLADASVDGVFDLLGVPADGSAGPTALAAAVSTDGQLAFELGPDGARAVYVSDGHLWSVPLDGSASPVDLTGALVAGGAVSGEPPFRLDPSGSRVVFRADKESDEVFELYSVPADGSAGPVKLNGPLISGLDVTQYAITPDGSRAVFSAKALYSVPVAGGSRVTIGLSTAFALGPDSSRVVFTQQLGGGLYGLYSRPVDASASAVRLDPAGNIDLCTGGVTFAVSPDSSRVAFVDHVGGSLELYGAPIDGSAAPVQLSAGGVQTCASGAAFPFDLPISAGGRVLYLADPDVDDVFELFSVPIDGSAGPVALDDPPACGGDVTSAAGLLPRLVPGGELVLYLADQDTDEVRELYAVAADRSSAPVKLNAPLVPDVESGDVTAFELGAGGAFAVYLADPDEDERLELFAVPTAAPAPAARLSGTLVACGDVSVFRLAPDGTRAVFVADRDADDLAELYSVPLDGSASPLKLNDPFGAGGGVGSSPVASFPSLEVSPDSGRALYYARPSAADPLLLYSVPLDGSASPVPLAEASAFRIGADGARVVYLAPSGELFAVPVDGSSAPLDLVGTLAPGASLLNAWLVPEFEVSPDGSRAVFVGDLTTDEVVELYSVPLDGGAAPLRLNGNLVAGGDVRALGASIPSFRITPDGLQVVYAADPFFDEQVELLGVPLDGSASFTQISGAPVSGGDVREYEITPDGRRVLYLADQLSNERFELFSRRLDGIGLWVQLSSALAFNRDVAAFRIAPDSLRAVYQADARTNDVFELFAVPVDASAPAVLVGGELAPGESVAGFLIDPGGRLVAYVADRRVDERYELFVGSLGGGWPARVSGELAAGGDVLSAPGGFALDRHGRAYYLADQDTDGVVELYASVRRARTSGAPATTVTR